MTIFLTCFQRSKGKTSSRLELASFGFESIVREPPHHHHHHQQQQPQLTAESLLSGAGGAVQELLERSTRAGSNGLIVALGGQRGQQQQQGKGAPSTACDSLARHIVEYIFSSHEGELPQYYNVCMGFLAVEEGKEGGDQRGLGVRDMLSVDGGKQRLKVRRSKSRGVYTSVCAMRGFSIRLCVVVCCGV